MRCQHANVYERASNSHEHAYNRQLQPVMRACRDTNGARKTL